MKLARFHASWGNLGAVKAALATVSQSEQLQLASLFQLHQTRSSSLLSYEEIAAGSPTPKHPVASPSRTLLVLHGLLGCGRNWRTWAAKLVQAAAASHPSDGGPWRALLLDLRCHGNSTRRPGLHHHPPNNMMSAAEDVSRLIRHLMGSQPPGAVLGHSMGGKVALALLQQSAAAAVHQQRQEQGLLLRHRPSAAAPSSSTAASSATAALAAPTGTAATAITAAAAVLAATSPSSGVWCTPPRQLWILDSQPGLVTGEQDTGTGISRVLDTVNSVPLPIPSRAWLLSRLRERGLSPALAQWLASNLVPLPPAAAAAAAGPAASPHPYPQPHSHHRHHHPNLHLHLQHQHRGENQHELQQQHLHVGGSAVAQHGGGGGGPLTWSFNLQCAGAMYMSYRTTEFWQVLENPPYGTDVHLVQGARSDRWPEAMQRRLNQAAATAAAAQCETGGGGGGRFRQHVLDGAGHWLHVDNPEGLMRLVLPRLAGL